MEKKNWKQLATLGNTQEDIEICLDEIEVGIILQVLFMYLFLIQLYYCIQYVDISNVTTRNAFTA